MCIQVWLSNAINNTNFFSVSVITASRSIQDHQGTCGYRQQIHFHQRSHSFIDGGTSNASLPCVPSRFNVQTKHKLDFILVSSNLPMLTRYCMFQECQGSFKQTYWCASLVSLLILECSPYNSQIASKDSIDFSSILYFSSRSLMIYTMWVG